LGALIAPSAGNWYAGSSSLPWLGMRAAGTLSFMWGVAEAFSFSDCGECGDRNNAVPLAILGGLGTFIAGTIVDIATAPSAVRRHNRELSRLIVAPTVHDGGAGVMLGGAF
ncbi:MAG: hypothetical protein H7138_18780, partial [Myxococcales bacterium]|nr:hypothetical protein [Myxococcales bacterium]